MRPTYTLAEANAVLPALRRVLIDLRAARDRATDLRRELDALWPRAEERGVLDAITAAQRELDALTDRLREIARWFDERGVILRDVDRGLVDFPSRLGPREVFLCWLESEPRVEHWHGVEEGFTGRKRFADSGTA